MATPFPASAKPAPEVLDLVGRCAALSLDIFDTALLRRVDEPHDVFRLVAAAYRASRPSAPRFDFAGARVTAEQRARNLAFLRARHREVTLDEIYDALRLPAGWERSALQESELAIERHLLVRNPYVHELYRAAVERGVPVIFLSDMYLPSSFLSGLLDDAGYETRRFLLVSSEADGASKASGGLYRDALARLGLRADEVLHIGDNVQSDVSMAMRAGLSTWHYRRCGEIGSRSGTVHPGRSLAAAVTRGLIHNRLAAHRGGDQPSDAYVDGFTGLGLLWHHHAGDETSVRETLDLLPDSHRERWTAGLEADGGVDVLRGASDFHGELSEVTAGLPWLDVPAVDAALALSRGARPEAASAGSRRGVVNAQPVAGGVQVVDLRTQLPPAIEELATARELLVLLPEDPSEAFDWLDALAEQGLHRDFERSAPPDSVVLTRSGGEGHVARYEARLHALASAGNDSKRRGMEYLMGWMERERASGDQDAIDELRHGVDAVKVLMTEVATFHRRFAPAKSVRSRAFEWAIRCASDVVHATSALFDMRDDLLDRLRTRRR
ncbi:MAG: HAD-IA family hydrolase [Polyangia bacterium]